MVIRIAASPCLAAAIALALALPAAAGSSHDWRRDAKRAGAHVTNSIHVDARPGHRLSRENETALVNMMLLRETVRMQQLTTSRRCPGVIEGAAADCVVPSGPRVIGAGAR